MTLDDYAAQARQLATQLRTIAQWLPAEKERYYALLRADDADRCASGLMALAESQC